MARFRIRPTDPTFSSIELFAIDASGVLGVVKQMGCGEAHIDREGIYWFTVKPEGDQVWHITHGSPEESGQSSP